MYLYVLSPELDMIGIIDNFQSLSWTAQYHGPGSFTLEVPLTEEMLLFTKVGNVILKEDDACYVTRVSYNVNLAGIEVITAFGASILNYFSKRIIWDAIHYSGSAEGLIRKMIEDNTILCAEKRVIPHLALGDACGASDAVSVQISHDNLLESVMGTCNTYMLGMRMDLNISARQMTFHLYQGTDRSLTQTIVAPCVFSRLLENVSRQTYSYDAADCKNTGLIGGEGEGELRKKVLIEGGEFGLDRTEVFIDARDLSSSKQENGQTVVMEEREYIELLRSRGEAKLAQFTAAESVDCDVSDTAIVYKKDYFLGDIVTILDPKWDIAVNVRVMEVTETYENGITLIQPIFGNQQLNLIQKIKREVR